MTLPWVLAVALILGIAALGVGALAGAVLVLVRPSRTADR